MHIPFISFICFSIFGLFGGPQEARRCRKSYPSLVLTSDITLCLCLCLHLHLSLHLCLWGLHSGIYVCSQFFVLHSPLSLFSRHVPVWLHSPDSCEHAYLIWLCLWVFPLSIPLSFRLSPLVSSCRLSCVYLRNFYCPLWVSLGVWARVSVHSCLSVSVCVSRTYRIFRFFMGLLNCFM